MHGNYSYWRFSRRVILDARLSQRTAKSKGGRAGSTEQCPLLSALHREEVFLNTLRRLLHCFYGACLWFSLPLAVLNSNGWLGLLSHGLAITGATTLLEAPFSKPGTR
jgi:hypothetical protein